MAGQRLVPKGLKNEEVTYYLSKESNDERLERGESVDRLIADMAQPRANRFANSREAKEFLISKVLEEGERQGKPLSELERKMLHFTETEPTLPDMLEVSDRFDQEYDQWEYETKIVKLLKAAYHRDLKKSPSNAREWEEAVIRLKDEDHYILVMTDRALPITRRPIGNWRLLVALTLIFAVYGAVIIEWDRFMDLVPFPQKYLILVIPAGILALWALDRIGVLERIQDWIFGDPTKSAKSNR